MDDIKAKQQLLEKIKSATNILVTVSDNPTVDALSAAIGLTLLFDKMDKHATAVFSGVVPPAIAFLEPEKILDDTTDSLRDFIIALDKEKADHLRYKVEGDAVKIFITPYKTTITSDDLEFSQGDYNVELVIALGVDDQDHLDKALESHGKILHDAAVATITAGDQTSTLGGIDWHDDKASSLSEMLTGLSEALKSEKNKSLINAQIATAYLTGIVAQTERFSNRNTTSKVMTVASQLMAAGADQQLIATKLEEPRQTYPDPIEEDVEEPDEPSDDSDSVSADGTLKIGKHKADDEKASKKEDSFDEEPRVPSAAFETLEEMDTRVKEEERAEATEKAEAALNDLNNQVPTAPSVGTAVQQTNLGDSPSFGGTLNATTEQAEDDARREQEDDQNKTILQHSYLQPSEVAAMTAPGSEAVSPTESSEASDSAYAFNAPTTAPIAPILPQPPTTQPPEEPEYTPEPVPVPEPEPTPAPAPMPMPEPVIAQPAPLAPPVDLGLPMPPPLPDFSQGVPPLTGPYAPPSDQPPAILGDILAQEAPQPQPNIPPVQPSGPYAPPPASNDPAQFKIPGQQ
jgi:hypothetical protein